jgi:hypothetical protein
MCFSLGRESASIWLSKFEPPGEIHMTRSLSLAPVVLLIGSVLAGASTLISKQQAEKDALKTVGGGTVVQAQRGQWKGYQIWDVSIT